MVRTRSAVYILLTFALAGMMLAYELANQVPAHGGADQNGYLVGGKMLAEHGSTKQVARNPDTGKTDPFMTIGRMWVGAALGTERERYYPKYPIGLSLLYAGAWKMGGAGMAYLVSPICMALAVVGVFFLVRWLAGEAMGFLGAVVFATSPVTLALWNNPNSHASSVCLVVWGMYLLMRWHEAGGAWRAIGAGLLLGCAVTIRYTEGLLILPVMFLTINRALARDQKPGRGRFSSPEVSRVGEAIVLVAAWGIPVLLLACFNLRAMGALTGYDPTNESAGFAWNYFASPGSWSSFNWFAGNWHAMLHQLHDTGLPFVFPVALLGLVILFWNRPGTAVALALWIVPGMLVYSAYYWAPDRNDRFIDNGGVTIPVVSYLRFFLTIIPALIACAFGGLARLRLAPSSTLHPPSSILLAAGLLTALAALLGLRGGIVFNERDQYQRMQLAWNTSEIKRAIGNHNAVVFCPEDRLVNHLQFVTPYRFYDPEMFSPLVLRRMMSQEADPADPQALDPNRRKALRVHVEELTRDQHGSIQEVLAGQEKTIIEEALAHGRKVYFVAEARMAEELVRRVTPGRDFEAKKIATWTTDITPPPERGREVPRAQRPGRLARQERLEGMARGPWAIIQITSRPRN